jgi:hypothetical protein
MTNHNVETCRNKKRIDHGGNHKGGKTKSKSTKTSSYACHIYGLNGHKMTDCPKFAKMQKMFHGKSLTITKVQPVVKT